MTQYYIHTQNYNMRTADIDHKIYGAFDINIREYSDKYWLIQYISIAKQKQKYPSGK